MDSTPTRSPEMTGTGPDTSIRVGTVRRFGRYGVLYEIVRPIDPIYPVENTRGVGEVPIGLDAHSRARGGAVHGD